MLLTTIRIKSLRVLSPLPVKALKRPSSTACLILGCVRRSLIFLARTFGNPHAKTISLTSSFVSFGISRSVSTVLLAYFLQPLHWAWLRVFLSGNKIALLLHRLQCNRIIDGGLLCQDASVLHSNRNMQTLLSRKLDANIV